MMNDIPFSSVSRLSDWLGVWAMEANAAAVLLDTVLATDWAKHLAQAVPTPTANYQMADVGGRKVAIVPVVGTLMKSRSSFGGTSSVDVRRQLRAAAADPEISAILIRVDSPGGTVAGTSDLAAEVQRARSSKPVWAQIEDMGASAAYWVASQASRVFASNGTTLVGSIGTLLTVEKGRGDSIRVFRTGPHKGAGIDELTDDQAAHLQSLVEGMQAEFSAAVQSGRRMTAAQLTEVATGAAWLASKAMDLRLIDGVQSVEKTLLALSKVR